MDQYNVSPEKASRYLTRLTSIDENVLIETICCFEWSLIGDNRVIVDDGGVQQANRVRVVSKSGVGTGSSVTGALRLSLEEVILCVALSGESVNPGNHDIASDH